MSTSRSAMVLRRPSDQGEELAVFDVMEDLNFQHVTGMNLPLVIQVLLDRNDSSVEQTVADAMEAASECVVHVNALFSADLGEDDLAL